MQQEPGSAENAPLIKPAKVLGRFRTLLASLPNRDRRSPVELVQTAGRGAVHRRTQPAEIVRDPPRPGYRRRSPWILISPALDHARWTHQRDPKPSDPIRSLSHQFECQHSATLLPNAEGQQSFTSMTLLWTPPREVILIVVAFWARFENSGRMG
jgi:hypothetical protein